jgi:hypothetical protein
MVLKPCSIRFLLLLYYLLRGLRVLGRGGMPHHGTSVLSLVVYGPTAQLQAPDVSLIRCLGMT